MENAPAPKTPPEHERRQELHRLLGELMINITNQVFKDRELYIDGYRFINCSFLNCTLITYRGTFEFHRCFEVNTRHQYWFETLKTIQLYTANFPMFAHGSKFQPIKHDDGTFSIGQGSSL